MKINNYSAHECITNNNIDTEKLKSIFNKNIDVNIQDPKSHMTLLHRAIEAYHPQSEQLQHQQFIEATSLILDQPNIQADLKDHFGNTPLHIAIANGASNIYIPATKKGNQDKCLYELLIEKIGNIHQENHAGDQYIHIAAKQCNPSLIKALIQNGANVNAQNHQFETPLHQLIEQQVQASKNGSVSTNIIEAIDLLIKAGAQIDLRNKAGNTVLHSAIELDDQHVIHHLLNNNRSETFSNGKHHPIHLAVIDGKNEALEGLCTYTDVNQKTLAGESALHLAVKSSNNAAISTLLANKANPNLGGWTKTPLIQAALNQNWEAIKLLANAKNINVNARYKGFTALSYLFSQPSVTDEDLESHKEVISMLHPNARIFPSYLSMDAKKRFSTYRKPPAADWEEQHYILMREQFFDQNPYISETLKTWINHAAPRDAFMMIKHVSLDLPEKILIDLAIKLGNITEADKQFIFDYGSKLSIDTFQVLFKQMPMQQALINKLIQYAESSEFTQPEFNTLTYRYSLMNDLDENITDSILDNWDDCKEKIEFFLEKLRHDGSSKYYFSWVLEYMANRQEPIPERIQEWINSVDLDVLHFTLYYPLDIKADQDNINESQAYANHYQDIDILRYLIDHEKELSDDQLRLAQEFCGDYYATFSTLSHLKALLPYATLIKEEIFDKDRKSFSTTGYIYDEISIEEYINNIINDHEYGAE